MHYLQVWDDISQCQCLASRGRMDFSHHWDLISGGWLTLFNLFLRNQTTHLEQQRFHLITLKFHCFGHAFMFRFLHQWQNSCLVEMEQEPLLLLANPGLKLNNLTMHLQRLCSHCLLPTEVALCVIIHKRTKSYLESTVVTTGWVSEWPTVGSWNIHVLRCQLAFLSLSCASSTFTVCMFSEAASGPSPGVNSCWTWRRWQRGHGFSAQVCVWRKSDVSGSVTTRSRWPVSLTWVCPQTLDKGVQTVGNALLG